MRIDKNSSKEGTNTKLPDGFKLLHKLDRRINKTNAEYTELTLISWSPNGKTLASASMDGTITFWDIESEICRENIKEYAHSIAWSPDGQMLATVSGFKTVKLWDINTGSSLQTLKGHSDAVYGIAWSPDGQMLASSSKDKTVRLWDVNSWKLHKIFKGHSGEVSNIAWSPDGQILASASSDLRFWNVKTGELHWIVQGIAHL
jgi:WD40 repeat protein